MQRDVGAQSKLGLAYPDEVEGPDSNRLAEVDGRFLFGGVYTLDLQDVLSRTVRAGRSTTAPLWEAAFSRNGRRFRVPAPAHRHPSDFQAESGVLRRGDILHANADYRFTLLREDRMPAELSQTDYVGVLAITPDGLIPLVRQFRPAAEEFTWEFPAGAVDADPTGTLEAVSNKPCRTWRPTPCGTRRTAARSG